MVRPLSNLNLALSRASSTGFVPSKTPGLTCWMDAQMSSTITGPTDITAWASRVGSVVFSGGASGRPSVVVVNSRDMINFDGTESLETSAGQTALHPGDADFTTVCVYRSTNAGRGMVWWKETDGDGKWWMMRCHVLGDEFEFGIDDGTAGIIMEATDVDYSDDDIRVVFGVRDGTNMRFYFGNGGALAEDSASPVAIGAYGTLGDSDTWIGDVSLAGGQGLDGEVGELLFYNKALSTFERGQLYDFLVDKWGL